MKNILYTLVFIILSSVVAHAQSVVTGTVTDTKGLPVIGAAVTVDGDVSAGAITDLDGKYSLSVSGNKAVIVFTCLSYVTAEVPLEGRSALDVVLKEDSELLDEVVVVGYGAMRRSDLTGSVTSVDMNESEASQASSLDQMLQGKAAGVAVVANSASPDAAVSVRVGAPARAR